MINNGTSSDERCPRGYITDDVITLSTENISHDVSLWITVFHQPALFVVVAMYVTQNKYMT